jgi:hypothetical protein
MNITVKVIKDIDITLTLTKEQADLAVMAIRDSANELTLCGDNDLAKTVRAIADAIAKQVTAKFYTF